MRKNIKGILFDLDDTLIDTYTVFKNVSNQVEQIILQKYNVEKLELEIFLEKTSVDIYKIAKVNPNKWILFTEKIKNEFNISDTDTKIFLNIYREIYTTLPELKSGTIKLLQRLKQNSIKIGLVTHAQEEYTNFKLNGLNIKKYFDHIEIADQNREKSHIDWSNATKLLNLKLPECVIVGDNIKGDIIAGFEAGFRNLIWIDKEDGWKVYRTGQLPKDTFTAKNLNEVEDIIFN